MAPAVCFGQQLRKSWVRVQPGQPFFRLGEKTLSGLCGLVKNLKFRTPSFPRLLGCMTCLFVCLVGWLVLDPFESHMDLCNELFGRPAVAKSLRLNIARKLFNQFYNTCHAYRHHRLPQFYTAFTDVDLDWVSHRSARS